MLNHLPKVEQLLTGKAKISKTPSLIPKSLFLIHYAIPWSATWGSKKIQDSRKSSEMGTKISAERCPITISLINTCSALRTTLGVYTYHLIFTKAL